MIKYTLSITALTVSILSTSAHAATIELQFDNGWTVDLIDGYYGENPVINGYGSSSSDEFIMFNYGAEARFNGSDRGDNWGSLSAYFYRPETNRMLIVISDHDWIGYEDRENIFYTLDSLDSTAIYSNAFDLPSVLNSIVGVEGYFNYSHEIRVVSEIQDPWTPYADFTTTYSEFGTTTLTSWDYRTTVVPIPAAAWLFGSGLLGLVGLARKRRA